MLKNVLAKARIYSLFMSIIGAARGRELHIKDHIRPKQGDRILDIGCGPADLLEALPPVEYHGFDLSADYIESARKRFGNRGTFHVEAVNAELVKKYSGFDLVLATGVLHHLNDAEAVDLFSVARAALKPAGRLITLDGCFVPGQSRIAKYFLDNDRGEFVRTREGYEKLAAQVFPTHKVVIRQDMLNIPYTHIIMECST